MEGITVTGRKSGDPQPNMPNRVIRHASTMRAPREHRVGQGQGRVRITPAVADALLNRDPAGARLVREWASAVDNAPFGQVFEIGQLGYSQAVSRKIALVIARELCKALVRRGAPSSMRVELGIPHESLILDGFRTRTLLPHHDSIHSCFLTPSRVDVPSWSPAWRKFTSRGITATTSHKLYFGIFILEAGDGASVTTFFDYLAIIRRAYERRFRGCAPAPIADLAGWLGANVRSAWTSHLTTGVEYLTIASSLGCNDEALCRRPLLYAESLAFPNLRGRAAFERVLVDTLGMDYRAFCKRFERRSPNRQFDFVVGHNLTILHGGWRGGSLRVLEPVCFVVDSPSGARYERWLARSWRRPPKVPPQRRAAELM
jgi:hypothetical protein